MGGNTFGTLFRVTTFGESHGPGLGCVIDGCPAGLPLAAEDIKRELARRRPGRHASGNGPGASTSRNEADEPEILSGVFEGKTLGTPIAILVRNNNQHSEDYDDLKDLYRPGHADWPWEAKYGFRDHRGGGRTSGRETLGRVAAGAVAKAFLGLQGIEIRAWTSSAAGIDAAGPDRIGTFSWDEIENNPLRMPDLAASTIAMEKIETLRSQGDSAGCTITCIARNLPPGLGEPVFDKLDARIASAMLSLGSAKAIEFGAGSAASRSTGSEMNDIPVPSSTLPIPNSTPFPAGPPAGIPAGTPAVTYKTNNAGGILGGLSTGAELHFTVFFKPVSSIMKSQDTINRQGEKVKLFIHGRHDACIAPRVVPVVEAMCALVLADFMLLQRSAR